jgi:hypothetical protein
MTTPPPVTGWEPWAPPLDPPTTGGLPADQAQAIADAAWTTDPHLCAALQWESYAAMLPPSGGAVASVSTGAQSVSYSPPMPGGDAGMAMARAAWHRSFCAIGTIPVTVADPAKTSAPGTPWAADDYDWYWEVDTSDGAAAGR